MEDNTDENDTTVMCLFCDESYSESQKLLEHMKVRVSTLAIAENRKNMSFTRKHICSILSKSPRMSDGRSISKLNFSITSENW